MNAPLFRESLRRARRKAAPLLQDRSTAAFLRALDTKRSKTFLLAVKIVEPKQTLTSALVLKVSRVLEDLICAKSSSRKIEERS
jgi:hypothetical protein